MSLRASGIDFRVMIPALDPQEALASFKRVYQQYQQSMQLDQPMIIIHHLDLAHVLVLAGLWVEEGR